jgi:threonine dehydrogenase-like Zn-dependent dehydrogenase
MKYTIAAAGIMILSVCSVALAGVVTATPEPNTIILLGGGAVGLGVLAWLKNRKK